MLRIDDTIFSFDILEKQFCCDLPECLGSCCRYGDSGAPLTKEETLILNEIWPEVRSFMRNEGIEAVEKLGTSISDFENESVTPLINEEECAYTIKESGIYYCAIERAWSAGKINFRKPLSCHLFPAKFKHFSDFRAVNYQELKICQAARDKGRKEKLYVYEFLKEPLTRALGPEMYEELCAAGEELRKNPRSWNR